MKGESQRAFDLKVRRWILADFFCSNLGQTFQVVKGSKMGAVGGQYL